MSFWIYALLTYVFPAAMGLTAALLSWRPLASPWLFAAVAILASVGLHQVISGCWSIIRLGLGAGGFYLERSSEMTVPAMPFEAAGVAVAVAVFGWPLLMQLRNAFPKL